MGYRILKPELKRQIKGILFDMDGLVLDSEILYNRFWIEAMEELGYHMTREQGLGMRSLNKSCAQAYLDGLFGPGIDYDTARDIRIRRMDAYVEKNGVEPKAGIYELLEYAKLNKLPCAITTSSPLMRAKQHLTPLGLWDKFDVVCSGKEVLHGKPEPDIYIYGAESLKLKPSECLALEDSPAGIESAWRAGTLPVVIPDMDKPDEKSLSRCFARADSLLDIIGIIKELRA